MLYNLDAHCSGSLSVICIVCASVSVFNYYAVMIINTRHSPGAWHKALPLYSTVYVPIPLGFMWSHSILFSLVWVLEDPLGVL